MQTPGVTESGGIVGHLRLVEREGHIDPKVYGPPKPPLLKVEEVCTLLLKSTSHLKLLAHVTGSLNRHWGKEKHLK